MLDNLLLWNRDRKKNTLYPETLQWAAPLEVRVVEACLFNQNSASPALVKRGSIVVWTRASAFRSLLQTDVIYGQFDLN